MERYRRFRNGLSAMEREYIKAPKRVLKLHRQAHGILLEVSASYVRGTVKARLPILGPIDPIYAHRIDHGVELN